MHPDSTQTSSNAFEPDLLSVAEFCRAIGVGRTTAYELIAAREVVPIRIGRRTLIPRTEKDQLVARRLEAARSAA